MERHVRSTLWTYVRHRRAARVATGVPNDEPDADAAAPGIEYTASEHRHQFADPWWRRLKEYAIEIDVGSIRSAIRPVLFFL